MTCFFAFDKISKNQSKKDFILNNNQSKKFNIFADIKNNKGLTLTVILPYMIMLMPVIQTILFFIFYLIVGTDPIYVGNLSTAPIFFLLIFGAIFSLKDIPKLIEKSKNKVNKEKFSLFKYPEVTFLCFTIIYLLITSFLHGDGLKCWQFATTNENVAGSPVHLQETPYHFIYYAVCFCFAFLQDNKNTIKHTILTFLGISLYCGILCVIDPSNQIPLTNSNCPWSSLFGNSNHYAYFLCMVIICSACLYFNTSNIKMKIFASIVFTFNSIISIFNNTLGSMLAILIVLILIPLIYSLHAKKFNWQYLLPLVLYIIFSFAIIPLAKLESSHSWYTSLFDQIAQLFREIISIFKAPTAEENAAAGTSRWGLWITSISAILNNPILGDGNLLFRPHNEYLQLAEHHGLPTLIFYLTALIIVLPIFTAVVDAWNTLIILTLTELSRPNCCAIRGTSLAANIIPRPNNILVLNVIKPRYSKVVCINAVKHNAAICFIH